MADASTLPTIGSTWERRPGQVYHVDGYSNMRQPPKVGFAPTIHYHDAQGEPYSCTVESFLARMTWLADPVPTARAIDPEHARRVAELISANSREVEARRAAQREVASLKERIAGLLQLGRDRIVYEEFDCPGDTPISCGLWCPVCNEHVEDDRATGHKPSCPLNDHLRSGRPDPANDAGEADRIRALVRQQAAEVLASPSERVAAECNAVLEQVAAERGCTPAEVLRDAIAKMRQAHHG